MTLYCTACALLPPRVIGQAIDKIERQITTGKVVREDRKQLAREMRHIISDLADWLSVDLSLRHKRTRTK